MPPTTALTAPSSSITQGTWPWLRTEYSDGSSLAALDPSKYTIALLASGRISVQADCNSGSGIYTLESPRLTIGPVAMSLLACGPDSQDTHFLADLGTVVSYVFDGQHLVLNLPAEGGTMTFEPLPLASLVGVAWRVTGYNNGRGGVVSVVPATQLSATFGADGTLSGDTGCNTFRASYTLAGATVTIGPIATTRRACLSDAASTQEQAFLAALGAASSYELVGDRLALWDAAGATQLSLVRPTVQPAPTP